MNLSIRREEPGDYATIYDVTEQAFREMPFADHDEQNLVDRLRGVSGTIQYPKEFFEK